jgi:hypothetical protein
MAESSAEQRGDTQSGVSRFFRAVKESWRREAPAEADAGFEPPREAAAPPPAAAPEPQPAEPAAEPEGPKRGGWWQQGQK